MSNVIKKNELSDLSQEVIIIEKIKNQIKHSQQKAMLNANKEMIVLYWNIGKVIMNVVNGETSSLKNYR